MKRIEIISRCYSFGIEAKTIGIIFDIPFFEVEESLKRLGHCSCCIAKQFDLGTTENKNSDLKKKNYIKKAPVLLPKLVNEEKENV